MTRIVCLLVFIGVTALPGQRVFASSPVEILAEDSRMVFFDTTLDEVVLFLSDQHRIQIAIAPGVNGRERVNFDGDGPFAVLLSHLLQPMDLKYSIEGNALLFSPIERRAYIAGLRRRADAEVAERDLERRTCHALEAAGGRVAVNELGWIAEVDLHGANIRDSEAATLRHFRRLSRLDLSGTAITDAGLEPLKDLWQLRELSLCGTLITDAGVTKLKSLRYLETLDVSETRITDAGLQKLTDLRSLHTVYVKDTRVTTEGFVKLHKSGTRVRAYDDRPVRPDRSKDGGRSSPN